jgi:hypothetical protein
MRDSLLAHAQREPEAVEALNSAVDVTRYIRSPQIELSIKCAETTAKTLLRIAVLHCPAAAFEIAEALTFFMS